MQKCRTDITQDQANILLQTIYTMISADYMPYTIVDYVCAELNIPTAGIPAPEISATNWCLLTCVSACLYNGTFITPPTTVTYINKPVTYVCVTSCFPTFPVERTSGGGGGGAGVPPNNAPENLEEWQAEQIANVLIMEDNALDFLDDVLSRAYSNLGTTVASFAIWIVMLSVHLSTEIKANTIKTTGFGVKEKAALKTLGEDLDSAFEEADNAVTQAESAAAAIVTEEAAGHVHATLLQQIAHLDAAITALQTSITDISDLETKITDDIGEDIEQFGQYTEDAGDMVFDIAEIAFAAASLGSMVSQISQLISHTRNRKSETSRAAQKTINDLNEKYTDQITNATDINANLEGFNEGIDETVNLNNSSSTASNKGSITISNDSFELNANANQPSSSAEGTK